jgi:hypothetical protein
MYKYNLLFGTNLYDFNIKTSVSGKTHSIILNKTHAAAT